MSRVLAVLAFCTLWCLPRFALAQEEPEPDFGELTAEEHELLYGAPPGHVVTMKPRRGLVLGGGLMLGISYGIGLGFAGLANYEEPMLMAVPVAGPFLALARWDYHDLDGYITFPFLLTDGVAQVAGASMLIAGFAASRPTIERVSVSEPSVALEITGPGARIRGAF